MLNKSNRSYTKYPLYDCMSILWCHFLLLLLLSKEMYLQLQFWNYSRVRSTLIAILTLEYISEQGRSNTEFLEPSQTLSQVSRECSKFKPWFWAGNYHCIYYLLLSIYQSRQRNKQDYIMWCFARFDTICTI